MRLEYVDGPSPAPIKIRYPKDIEKFMANRLIQYAIYDRWRKVAHCTCCSHTWNYEEVIRKDDIVYCPKCGQRLKAKPHTSTRVWTDTHGLLIWSYRNNIRFATLYAYYHYDELSPEETKDTMYVSVTNMGEIKAKEQRNYIWAWQWKTGKYAYELAKSTYCSYEGWDIEIHPSAAAELAKTFLAGRLPSWTSYDRPQEMIKALSFYARHPQTEYLEKAGLEEIVKSRLQGIPTYIWPNWRAKKLHTFLGLSAQDIDKLKAWDCLDAHHIAMYKQLKRYKRNPKKDQLDMLAKWFEYPHMFHSRYSEFAGMDFYKIALYLERQEAKGESYRWGLKTTYADYLRQLRTLDYPKDDYYLYPKSLTAAHDRISEEYREMREKERRAENRRIAKEKREKQKKFEKDLLPALEKLAYTDGTYSIFPLRCYKDFQNEGKHQHNCVASYYDRAITGKTKIFVMRLSEKKDTSLLTIELSIDNKDLRQVYAKGNTIPEDELMEKVKWWHKNIVLKKKKARKSA